jgi:hypothetical protein
MNLLDADQFAAELAKELHVDLGHGRAPELAPSAGPPPVLTPGLWASTCRGAEFRRCGRCELCEWERVADRFAFAAPWARKHRAHVERPRFVSLAHALRTLMEHEQHGRERGSALGPMLRRAGLGRVQGNLTSREVRSADDAVDVLRTLEAVFSEPHMLSTAERIRVLIERTHGVLTEMVRYEDIARRTDLSIGELRALVRHAKQVIAEDLLSRGLLPGTALRSNAAATPRLWRATEP